MPVHGFWGKPLVPAGVGLVYVTSGLWVVAGPPGAGDKPPRYISPFRHLPSVGTPAHQGKNIGCHPHLTPHAPQFGTNFDKKRSVACLIFCRERPDFGVGCSTIRQAGRRAL